MLLRCQRPILIIAGLIFAVLLFNIFLPNVAIRSADSPAQPVARQYEQQHLAYEEDDRPQTPQEDVKPDPPHRSPNKLQHPITHLIEDATSDFEKLKSSQSKSLEEAVSEYKRRYGLSPPPRFDKWFEFAREKNVQLIDEFDGVYHALLPFWGLEPALLRSRVREAIGYEDNGLIALLIRDGKVAKIEGGYEWLRESLLGMLHSFVHLLPDMDLAFNMHDEPRVVIPHDQLSDMVDVAKEEISNTGNPMPMNDFSPAPKDLQNAKRHLTEYRTSRFNDLSHQNTWTPSVLSCPRKSPVRDYREETMDDDSASTFSSLGFISNVTAFSDVCNTPSLRTSYGFFQRPNSYKVSHELIPVFSQSKISSFQDILYPSPWYWYNKTVDMDKPMAEHEMQYDPSAEFDWDRKKDVLWWRGTTTGGFSRGGGWRHHHRQLFVRNINGPGKAKILAAHGDPPSGAWEVAEVDREDFKNLTDIKFTGTGMQCDPGDCDAQREFFSMARPVDSQEAWKYKYLLDIDGNAFSGRFYAFLRSKSLPFKAALFREWHRDWIRPWVHYVPLSLGGEEHLEAVRWFDREDEGRSEARRIAEQGRRWSWEALRAVDLEAYLFRVLLEYARVVDDNRANIGFSLERETTGVF